MRETKVGVAVNKFRSHDSAEINGLVKNDQKLRDAVQAEKNNKKKLAIAAGTGTPSSSAISPSSSGSGSTTPKPSESTTPSAARKGPRNPKLTV